MLTIETKITRDISSNIRNQINHLTQEAFGFDTLFNLLEELKLEAIHTLAFNSTQDLVGHAIITERTFYIEKHILRAAYIDSVVTCPVCRGQGIGRKVMKNIVACADEHGFQIAGLATNVPVFYKKCGWHPWTGPLALNKDGEIIKTPDESGVMVYSLSKTPPLDYSSQLIASWRPHFPW